MGGVKAEREMWRSRIREPRASVRGRVSLTENQILAYRIPGSDWVVV